MEANDVMSTISFMTKMVLLPRHHQFSTMCIFQKVQSYTTVIIPANNNECIKRGELRFLYLYLKVEYLP